MIEAAQQLLAGGGALALGGIGCLAGAWSTAQQVASPDLAFADSATLMDRGKALNATGIALTVTGGALVIGGAVMWAVLARSRASQPREPTAVPKLALGEWLPSLSPPNANQPTGQPSARARAVLGSCW